jgi:hypothetical protein
MTEFLENYQLSRMRGKIGNRVIARVFVKKENGAIGITRREDEIIIPSFLFTGDNPKNPAEMDDDNRLYIHIDKKRMGRVGNIWLERGTWALVTEQPLPDVKKTVQCSGRDTELILARRDTHARAPIITLAEGAKVSITIGPGNRTSPSGRLYHVYFKRADPSEATQICRSRKPSK